MIAIVDTGGANIASVKNALARLGRDSVLTLDQAKIENASHVIFPGVGAAKDSMERLRRNDLVHFLQNLAQPVLGICLGMQIFFERSEEGHAACLGILPGVVKPIAPVPGFAVPHMGWNRVNFTAASPLTAGFDSGAHFYFVHSFRAPEGKWVLASCEYSETIPAIVSHKNYFGTQFHPERSAAAGQQLLKNFINL